MPIDNTLFGVWKTFSYGGNYYVVETADEAVKQEVSPKNYIIGTAMPRVLEVKGAEASLNIKAPLLVCSTLPRTGALGQAVNDGLTLIKYYGSGSGYMNGTFQQDPFFIFKSVGFSISSDQGATYTINAVGDYNALKSENTAATAGFGLTMPTSAAQYPTLTGYVYRVGSFYDFQVSVNGLTPYGYLQSLNVNIQYDLQSFSYVGQVSQRKFYGIGGMSATVSGTYIHSSRTPTGHGMPLQAEAPGISLPAPWTGHTPNQGGIAWPTSGTFSVYLRQSQDPGGGLVNVLPFTGNQRFIFSSTTLQASTGLLTTNFEGQMWAQTNTFS